MQDLITEFLQGEALCELQLSNDRDFDERN